jgi:dCMP deaminase
MSDVAEMIRAENQRACDFVDRQAERAVEKRRRMDRYFYEIAKLTGNLSHCVSMKVGAVLTFDDRIIATGYNGAVAGQPNCDDVFGKDFDVKIPANRVRHHDFSLSHEIHAELNAILDAGKRGTLIPGATLYVTYEPCTDCAKLVVAAGIKRVVYGEKYDLNPGGYSLMSDCGVLVERIE